MAENLENNPQAPGVRLLSLAALLFLLAGCSSLMLESQWRPGGAPIDGAGRSWHDSLAMLGDKEISIGFLNDNNYLYVRLVTTNREFERQIILRGLTFWFDPDGGEKKTFGVHFPLGIGRMGGYRPGQWRGERDSGSRRTDSIMVPVNDLQILGPDPGEVHRMTFAEATGIDARFQTSHDSLTYTLKAPITASGYFPFTIGARPGSRIGVTIETSNVRSTVRSPEGSDEGGGRRGGYGGRGGFGGRGGYGGYGGYGGGGFGRDRGSSGGQSKPFSQFARIQLADSVATGN